jgi:hypothetical protein
MEMDGQLPATEATDTADCDSTGGWIVMNRADWLHHCDAMLEKQGLFPARGVHGCE